MGGKAIMKLKKIKKAVAIMLSAVMSISVVACKNADSVDKPHVEDPNARETVTLTFGRQTTANPKIPDGDTYEDNAYIRMTEKELNVDIVDVFEAECGDDYNRQVALALSSGDLPDIMKVATKDEVRELYENELIADLSDYYDECASDYVKSLYDTYGGRTLANVTFDGQLMALPATAADAGPTLCWVRQDWVDSLGIEIDSDGDRCLSLDEVEELAKTFKEKNPAGASNPEGIAFDTTLTTATSDGTNSINAIAYAMGAYPRLWFENKDGAIAYGSTSNQMKETLGVIRDWFKSGVVDSQLGTRTWDDITSLLTNGQTGIVFGSWHTPDWLLNNVYMMDEKAVFTPFAVANKQGKINCCHCDAAGEYIVVSKDCRNPELAIMILNLFYDRLVNDKALLEKYPDVAKYLAEGVDGTVRPFNIEVKSSTYLVDEYECLSAALNGTGTKDEIPTAEERTNYDVISAYNEGNGDVTGWCKIHSRTKGVDMLKYLNEKDRYNWRTPVYPETTATMKTAWANLQTLEEESFIKIVTGTVDLDKGFDDFVEAWKTQGGDDICKEIEVQQAKQAE